MTRPIDPTRPMRAAMPPLRDAAAARSGTRVRLRPATLGDIPALVALFSDPAVTRWWPAPDPDAEARDHAGSADEPDDARWVVVLPGAAAAGVGLAGSDVIGLIQAHEETDPAFRHAGIDIALSSTVHGHGLGPDAIRTVAAFLFERGHHRLTIDPATANERAIRAYSSLGFRPVGVLRAYQHLPSHGWVDGLLMDLLVGEITAEPT
jgi:aminoglycoside 6'-N-acetyltransferase